MDDIAHKQTIICRQLFAGHVVGSRPMKRKKNLHGMFKCLNVVVGTVDAFTALECEVVYQPAFSAPQETDFLLHVSGGSDLKLKCVAKVRTKSIVSTF